MKKKTDKKGILKKVGKNLVTLGVGGGKTMKDLGLSIMGGAAYVADKAGAKGLSNEINRQRGRSQSSWDRNGLEKRANTRVGMAGQYLAPTIPIAKPVAIAAKPISAWRKARKAEKLRQAQIAANRSAGGRQAAQTYRNSLPRTPDTVAGKGNPIYPSRAKYNTITEYMEEQAKKKKKKLPKKRN